MPRPCALERRPDPSRRLMPFAVIGGDAMSLRQAVVGVLRTGARSGASRRATAVRASASRSSQHTLASTRAPSRRDHRVSLFARAAARRRRSTFAASADVDVADPAAVAAANDAAAEQGLVVRAIKEAKKNGEATKEQVDAEVAKLLELKKLAAELENPGRVLAGREEGGAGER